MRNTILIVEDDHILQLFLSEQLETLGWKTIVAPSTIDAMEEIRDHADRIAVMVTDVQMPGTRNGITLARQVRFGWPEIGVVVVSGASHPGSADLPDGVRFYSKPLNVERLIHVIEDAIEYAGSTQVELA